MACPYGYSLFVQGTPYLVIGIAFQRKRQRAGFFLCSSDELQSGYLFEQPGGILQQVMLIGLDTVQPDTAYIL